MLTSRCWQDVVPQAEALVERLHSDVRANGRRRRAQDHRVHQKHAGSDHRYYRVYVLVSLAVPNTSVKFALQSDFDQRFVILFELRIKFLVFQVHVHVHFYYNALTGYYCA